MSAAWVTRCNCPRPGLFLEAGCPLHDSPPAATPGTPLRRASTRSAGIGVHVLIAGLILVATALAMWAVRG